MEDKAVAMDGSAIAVTTDASNNNDVAVDATTTNNNPTNVEDTNVNKDSSDVDMYGSINEAKDDGNNNVSKVGNVDVSSERTKEDNNNTNETTEPVERMTESEVSAMTSSIIVPTVPLPPSPAPSPTTAFPQKR